MRSTSRNWSLDLHTLRTRLVAAAKRRFSIDTRSLAAFRIALGLLLLADLARRARNLRAFYTDFGVLPREAVLSQGEPFHWSLHLVFGDVWGQALLFVLAGGFAVALTIGYRTTLATVGSWLLLVSLHNRMPDVLNGGDVLLRLLLFWAMFLPFGARWAVDNAHDARQPTRAVVTSVATAALLLQVVIVYTTNVALKLGGDAWLSGDGLAYVFSLGQFTVLFGDYLGAYPTLLHVLDYLWLVTIAGAFLLIVLHGRWRTGYAGLLMTMHLGMLVTMRIGLIPLISVAALLPFLPSTFWNRLSVRLSQVRPALAVRRGGVALAARLPVVTVSGVPPALQRWKGRFTTVVPLVFLVLVVLWNVQFLGYSEVYGHDVVPEQTEPVIELTRTDQYWNMFAPNPLSTDGWIVASGRLENGTQIDAFHGGPVVWDRPADISATYPTERWRKYLVRLWRYDTTDRRHFAEHLCRRWNDQHDTKLQNLTVYFMEQPSRIDGGPEPINKVELVGHYC